ncbi:MAG: TonB family protein [Bacteroides sp.]|nr:TonB family protein [Bacteroides sp.]
MTERKKRESIALGGTLLLHAGVVLLLLIVTFTRPEKLEESGVEVMMGEVVASRGTYDPNTMVDVDILAQELPAASAATPSVPEPVEQELITQAEEESVVITSKTETQPKRPELKPEEKSKAEKTEEARKAAEATAEAQRRAAAEAAARQVAGAFGKGAQMDNRGNSAEGTGVEGSPQGNSNTGNSTGSPGYGIFDLGGRSLGPCGLPRPVYNVQDEGKVVVTITVNPAGEVIATAINRETNTVNPTLRKAAEDAAKKARFNQVSGVNNQTGTITYYFNLR